MAHVRTGIRIDLMPMLIILLCWLTTLFISFGLFAPRNATAVTALLVPGVFRIGSDPVDPGVVFALRRTNEVVQRAATHSAHAIG